jgi:quercetin dioxygenase-like cupin family protein
VQMNRDEAAASSCAGPGETFAMGHERITFLLTCGETDGRMVVVRTEAPAGTGPAPMHTHAPDEWIYVLEGTVTVFLGERRERHDIGPGESFHIPSGAVHSAGNLTATSSRALFAYSPGELMEQFFTRAGRLVTPGGEDASGSTLDDVLEIARRVGLQFPSL